MLRDVEDSTNFLTRYLWTAFVLLLVIGGLIVAMSRGEVANAAMNGTTLADHGTAFIR